MFKLKWTTTCLAGITLLGTAGSPILGENPSRVAPTKLEAAYTASATGAWETKTKTFKAHKKWQVWRSDWRTLESVGNGLHGFPPRLGKKVREIRISGPKGAKVVATHYRWRETRTGLQLHPESHVVKILDGVTPMTFTLSGEYADLKMKVRRTTTVTYEVRK